MTNKTMLIAVVAVFSAFQITAQDWEEVEITPTHVAGAVWVLEGAGGNIGVSVGDDGLLMVDDQFAPLSEKIDRAMKEIGEGKLQFLLNTHFHGDHTGGNTYFGQHAPVIAHANVRARTAVPQVGRSGGVTEALPAEALPVVTYEDGLSVHFNGEQVRLIHMPHAHTDGDSVVWFMGSNVVHMGDLLFEGRFPYVDVSHGGSVEGLIDALKKVLDIVPHDVKLIAGHGGPVATVDDLRASLNLIEETAALVQDGMRQGKSLEELKTAGLPERFADFSWQFISTETWIEIVWRSSVGLAGASAPLSEVSEANRQAVDNPARPEADRDRDHNRRPAEVLDFFGITSGMAVLDLMAGSGYYTEMLAGAVGSEGRVICQNSPFVIKRFADKPLGERLERMTATNVERHDAPLDDLGLAGSSVDLALMVLFYHDTYWQEVDRAAMNRQIFDALKPGAVFGVIDHHAEAGSGSRDNKSLHRIDAELVKSEILAAGFELVDSSDLLRHPEDDRRRNVFDPDIRGETDRFIFKFRKPE